jgi:glycerol-3-phosphate acyltransferase PlsY
MSSYFISALAGYLLGCFQTAYIIGKKVGNIDIRTQGSNNSGASNVTRVMGWKYGVITAVVDILKAAMAVVVIEWIYPASAELAFIAGLFAVIGHIYPVFLDFRGGKGAACIGGFMLAFDWRISIILFIAIFTITLLTDYIALGTIAMGVILPMLIWIFGYSMPCLLMAVLTTIIVITKHTENIRRIIKQEEVGLRAVYKRTANKQ